MTYAPQCILFSLPDKCLCLSVRTSSICIAIWRVNPYAPNYTYSTDVKNCPALNRVITEVGCNVGALPAYLPKI